MRIQPANTNALIQNAINTRLNAANASANPINSAKINRGADSAQFSNYIIKTRGEVAAEAAQAKVKSAAAAQVSTPAAPQAPIAANPSKTAPQIEQALTATPAAETKLNLVTDLTRTTDASTPTPRVYGDADLNAVTAAWGATRGDRAYSALADPNGDGVVNFDDQTHILSNWGQPVPTEQEGEEIDLSGPFGQAHLDAVKANFGAKQGEDRYLQDADANGDGIIDFDDITHILSNWDKPRTPPEGG